MVPRLTFEGKLRARGKTRNVAAATVCWAKYQNLGGASEGCFVLIMLGRKRGLAGLNFAIGLQNDARTVGCHY